MMLAIYWFDRKHYVNSSLALTLSISTKFLPVFLLIPIAFIFWRDAKVKELLKYIGIVSATWLAINLPFALTTPTGWWRFYKLNLERGADWGSIWLALQQLGINFTNLNYLSILLLLISMTSIAIVLFELKIHTNTCISCILSFGISNGCKQGVLTTICFMVNTTCCNRINK
jgi:uncharacterized membrane protein